MSMLTDKLEDLPETEPRLPPTNFGKIRMIYKLRTQRFYWAMAFFYSLFLNLILLWKYKL